MNCIIEQQRRICKFTDVKEFSLFLYEDKVYMKIPPSGYIGLGLPPVNAVRMSQQTGSRFSDDMKVTLVDGELKVTY